MRRWFTAPIRFRTPGSAEGRTGRQTSCSGRGQSLVEIALLLPVVLFFGLACIQFALIFRTYDDLVNVTRDAARWVSVHAQNTDATTRTAVTGRLPAGITAARLTLDFDPRCDTLNANNTCTGRTTGTQIQTTATYDLTDVLFIPTTLGWGNWAIRIPAGPLTYSIYMQVEPS